MQFNVVPRTGGLAINRKNRGKRGARQHNSHIVLGMEQETGKLEEG